MIRKRKEKIYHDRLSLVVLLSRGDLSVSYESHLIRSSENLLNLGYSVLLTNLL